MNESEVLDILRQIGCRTTAAGFIITHSQDGDEIRRVLPTLIEDLAEDAQSLTLEYCAVTSPSDAGDAI